MKDRLRKFIDDHGIKHWSFAARKDAEFMAFVDENSKDLPENTPFATRVYRAVNDESPICLRGGTRTLDSIERGYRFCGRAKTCVCASESVSSSLKSSLKGVDQAAIKAKAKATLKERYGVDNAGQTKNAREKHKAFYSDPLKVAEAVKKGAATMQERYGVDNALKLDIDRKAISQSHLTEEAKSILEDRDQFAKLADTMSTISISNLLGVHQTTVNNYIRKYDLEVHGSSYEREISAFLSSHHISFIQRDRKTISPLELDFYLPDHRLAIEFNGLYFHTEAIVGKDYHQRKHKMCATNGVRLLMINEDEWNTRPNVVKSKILNLVGLSERGVGARHLEIATVPHKEARAFLEAHHLQGCPSTFSAAYGAFHEGIMVAVMTFGIQRTTGHAELTRYCSDGKVYAGAFSKILKRAIANYPDGIITFADLRYSDGGLYESNGFEKIDTIRPDYKYTKKGQTYHKSMFTKARIQKRFGLDMTKMTEAEAMKSLGFERIYDCGKIKYRLVI